MAFVVGRDGCGNSIPGVGSGWDKLVPCSTFIGEFIRFEEIAGRLSMFFGVGPVKTVESSGITESGGQLAALFRERRSPCWEYRIGAGLLDTSVKEEDSDVPDMLDLREFLGLEYKLSSFNDDLGVNFKGLFLLSLGKELVDPRLLIFG